MPRSRCAVVFFGPLSVTVASGNPSTSMSLLYVHNLKPETVTAILELGPKAEQIADRWAMGWPARTLELEKQEMLLAALRNQAEQESQAIRAAQKDGLTHLADHEIAELSGLSSRPP